MERTRKQQHYESVERTCNQTALTLISSLKESVANSCVTDDLIVKLKEGNCNKVAVWENLKYLAFSKITLFVYTSSLLMVTLRLQLNLIGGYMFRNTMDETNDPVSSDLQQKYLSASQYLLTEGVAKLARLVQEKTEVVLKARSLKEKLALQDIEQIFWAIHSSVSSDDRNPCRNLPLFILSDNEVSLPEKQLAIYREIVNETRDLLESEEVVSLASSCVNRGFSYFVDNVAEYFIDRSPKNGTSVKPVGGPSNGPDPFFAANITDSKGQDFVELTHISIPMAKVIPIINGLVSSRESKSDVPYMWMQQLILMDNLKTLGANIYESFSCKVKDMAMF